MMLMFFIHFLSLSVWKSDAQPSLFGASQVPRLYFFSCSTQLSKKFILRINVKIPTIVGILTLINTTSERLKARNFFFLLVLYFMSS